MSAAPVSREPQGAQLVWPAGRRPIFLLDASSGVEERILRHWIERQRPAEIGPADYDVIRIPPTRRRRRISLERLEECLASEDDALLAPLRVAWLPRKRNGQRSVYFRDVLTGDPRDPGPWRQRWILRRSPDRCRVVAGEPAPISELRQRWRDAGLSGGHETLDLPHFVARQAELALERAERRLRGARYKVPKLIHQDILRDPGFRGGLRRLARQQERSVASLEREAARDLREIAATHSPFVIDLVAQLIRMLYSRGYDTALHYDREQLAALKSLSERYPVVFLPTHKSNLDHLVLQYALHENGHAPNHTAAGINMNFFPVGPLVRRSGAFFIRRSFKDDEVYKFVLRHYVDYLIRKRFSLEWYIEGGRSRSGKLLPPRFGMLSYVADAYRRGVADDVMLIPVSIAYDQISDVGDYAAEQRGEEKPKESFGWFVGIVRRLGRRYGVIHFRFGEPLSLAKELGRASPGAEPGPDEDSLAIRKLAFEVSVRINRATPITASSLVTLALLGTGDQALTVEEVLRALRNLLADVERRDLPRCGELDLDDAEGVQRCLEALMENDVVSRFSEGPEPVYRIGPEQQLQAAYYRNTVLHHFLNPAIVEMSLLRAGEAEVADRKATFWDEAMALRDLLKFEFFFSEKETFRGELRRELALQESHWERCLEEGADATQALVRRLRPFTSHRVLRPFLEAYRLVGDHLERREPSEPWDEDAAVRACLGLGRQYHLQRRIRSADACSKVLIQTGLRLAAHRGLLEPGPPELAARRAAFADGIRAVLRRIDTIDALAASRRAGILD